MNQQLQDSAFESGFFPDSRWSVVREGVEIPAIPERTDPTAGMYADVSWFELGHLEIGQSCVLSGRFNAEFWKIEETTLMCRIGERIGIYTHDSDYNWEERRYAAERTVTSLLTGE